MSGHMSKVMIEQLDVRRMLNVRMKAMPPTEVPESMVSYTYMGDVNLDESVGFDDLLTLAQNYNGGNKTWATGDSNYDGTVNFHDLLAIAQNYGVGTSGSSPSFAQDWALALSLAGVPAETPASDRRLQAAVVNKTLIIETGAYGDIALRASESRNGRLRIFGRDAAHAETQLISVRASSVRSISIFDGPESHSLTLASGFPAATVSMGAGNDKLLASGAPNTIYGGAGNDTIYAGGGDDLVYGGEGNDSLFGETGNDKLFGDAHKDYLDGGKGKNELVGGQGTDTFIVRAKDKVRREDRDRVKILD